MAVRTRLLAPLGVLAAVAGIVLIPSGGATGAPNAVPPGWPPTVSTANPNWMPAAAGNPRRAMPSLHITTWNENGATKRRQLLSHSDHRDGSADDPGTPTLDHKSMRLLWRDGDGEAWHVARRKVNGQIDWSTALHDTEPGASSSFANVHETADGTLIAISSHLRKKPDGRWVAIRWESTDHGISWTLSESAMTFGKGVTPGIVYQGLSLAPDGRTLLAPMYYRNEGTYMRWAQSVIASTDLGRTWAVRGVAAPASPWCPGLDKVAGAVVRDWNGFTEATVAATKDGRLVNVSRCDQFFLSAHTSPREHVRSYLYRSHSADGGATWSKPVPLDVPNTAPGTAGLPSYGVSPKLVRLGGDSLMLAFGRPGNTLAFNHSGNGDEWWTLEGWPKSKRWDNAPIVPAGDDGIAPEGRLWSHHGSSGYLGVGKLSPFQFMVVGDNCQADWGCTQYPPPPGSRFPHGTGYLLWNLLVSYVPR
ncbi:sialidase family protein [Herbihabitans rhizosphaerae]|uniref:sialidase family protein n=1 Tax=Herbihabitans rhizosphaerae TaxID=1872711 RepID=UPI00102B2795|nr:sialidase family protein [Herbihabitans rhizosphaerae]